MAQVLKWIWSMCSVWKPFGQSKPTTQLQTLHKGNAENEIVGKVNDHECKSLRAESFMNTTLSIVSQRRKDGLYLKQSGNSKTP